MKNYLKVLLGQLVIVLFGFSETYGQSVLDPYYFSGSGPVGTARYTSMGGAFATLGGDISGVSTNPAGGAVFVNHQIDLSLGIAGFETQVDRGEGTRFQINMPSAGVMFSIPVAESKWKAINFGLTSSRIKNFGRNIEYSDQVNAPNSFVDFLLADAGTIPPSELADNSFFGAMAYDTYILEWDENTGSYYTYAGGSSEQRVIYKRAGRNTDYDLNFSANYDNRLYLGVNLGVGNMEIKDEMQNIESFNDTLEKVEFRDDLIRSGSALLFKLGAIYRVNKNIRVSAFYHAPRHYRLLTTYTARLESGFEDNSGYRINDGFEFEYLLRLPSRYGGGVAVVLPKAGVFSIEAEKTRLQNAFLGYYDPGDGAFDADKSFFNSENVDIAQNYVDLISIRAGAEIKISNVALRAGINYQSQPFANKTDALLSRYKPRMFYTGGIGLRLNKNTSLDFFGTYASYRENFFPYSGGLNKEIKISEISIGTGLSLYF
ncbi:OmpP1/FadL family transporter [Luteibaculum oceani]|uniref:Transporter n=1 Tax=Luteibaculum oceani TaxID=1294296 RepID=A0A5C6VDI1_9FLAO|nr:outer membrane protein transport protein [Luteibaculum oceani]TXC81735.1 hypothetical protein FRX97_04255 [Luteibaculum oceani]